MADNGQAESSRVLALDLGAHSSQHKSAVWKYFDVNRNSSGSQRDHRCVPCALCTQKVIHGGG